MAHTCTYQTHNLINEYHCMLSFQEGIHHEYEGMPVYTLNILSSK